MASANTISNHPVRQPVEKQGINCETHSLANLQAQYPVKRAQVDTNRTPDPITAANAREHIEQAISITLRSPPGQAHAFGAAWKAHVRLQKGWQFPASDLELEASESGHIDNCRHPLAELAELAAMLHGADVVELAELAELAEKMVVCPPTEDVFRFIQSERGETEAVTPKAASKQNAQRRVRRGQI